MSKRLVRRGRSYRALRPIDPVEAKLFGTLLDGEFPLQDSEPRSLATTV